MNSWYTIRAQATGAEVVIYDEIGAYASIRMVARSPGLKAPSLFRHSNSISTHWPSAFAQRAIISIAYSADTP